MVVLTNVTPLQQYDPQHNSSIPRSIISSKPKL